MTKELAWNRAPVEIWDKIIRQAVYWDPIPTVAGSLTAYIAFLDSNCQWYHNYLDVCRTKGNLRLICRSWDVLIGRIPHDLVLTESDGNIWPSTLAIPYAKCIINTQNFGQYCKHSRGITSPNQTRKSITPPAFQDSHTWQLGDHENASMLVIDAKLWFQSCDDQLPSLKLHLQVLSLQNPHLSYSTSYLATSYSSSLTYLRLTRNRCSNAASISNLFLPCLNYLHITLSDAYPDCFYSFSTWSFPCLTTLIASRSDCYEKEKDEIKKLIAHHASTLSLLHLDLRWISYPNTGYYWIGNDLTIFDDLANLRILGVNIWSFRHDSTFEHGKLSIPCREPLMLYMTDIASCVQTESRIDVVEKLVRWHRMFPYGFSTLILPESWSDLVYESKAPSLWNSGYVKKLGEFCEAIVHAGIQVVDVHNVAFDVGWRTTQRVIDVYGSLSGPIDDIH